MRIEKVTFPGGAGADVAALINEPDGEIKGWGLFAHCFTCSKNLKVIDTIGRQLAAEGLGLLRFDFTGLGESEGEFADTTFTTNREDLIAAAEFLRKERGDPALLIGHSLGGAAVLSAAGDIEGVRCVATVAAPADPTHVRHLLTGADFDDRGRAEVAIGGRPFTIGRDFVEDLERHDLGARIKSIRLPLMIFHAPRDNIVGIDNAERIYKAAKHPKSFVSLGDADHLVSQRRDALFLGHLLSAWAEYYVTGE